VSRAAPISAGVPTPLADQHRLEFPEGDDGRNDIVNPYRSFNNDSQPPFQIKKTAIGGDIIIDDYHSETNRSKRSSKEQNPKSLAREL